MKKFLKKIARYFVTKFYSNYYRMVINYAWKRHNKEHRTFYVIDNPARPTELIALNRREFCYIRKELGLSSKQCPVSMLKAQCWYYTSNENNNDRMDPRDCEVRRLAFLRDRLKHYNLLEEKKGE